MIILVELSLFISHYLLHQHWIYPISQCSQLLCMQYQLDRATATLDQ